MLAAACGGFAASVGIAAARMGARMPELAEPLGDGGRWPGGYFALTACGCCGGGPRGRGGVFATAACGGIFGGAAPCCFSSAAVAAAFGTALLAGDTL